MIQETIASVPKAAVPVGTAAMAFGSITEPVAVILGIVYTLCMLAHLLWKWNKEYHEHASKTSGPV